MQLSVCRCKGISGRVVDPCYFIWIRIRVILYGSRSVLFYMDLDPCYFIWIWIRLLFDWFESWNSYTAIHLTINYNITFCYKIFSFLFCLQTPSVAEFFNWTKSFLKRIIIFVVILTKNYYICCHFNKELLYLLSF